MAVVSIFIGMGMLASCSVNDNPSKEEVTQKAEIETQVDASDDADKFLTEILPAGL